MEVRDVDIDRVPTGNLRVSRDDFAGLWRIAEQLGNTDVYAAGVALTCRWVACAIVVFNGRPGPAYAPITHTSRLAHEELLEREYLAAEKESMRVSGAHDRNRIFTAAAAATLRWAWKGQGPPPLVEIRAVEGD